MKKFLELDYFETIRVIKGYLAERGYPVVEVDLVLQQGSLEEPPGFCKVVVELEEDCSV